MMDAVQHSVAPLSPFTWVPAEAARDPGAANPVLHEIARLDLRFELIVEEFAMPFHHPLHRLYATHPLLCEALSPRQLHLLQYGVVVHMDERLVLVPAPSSCGDSGACLAASYQQVFARAMDSISGLAQHPLLPEYTFVVYRLPASQKADADGQAAEALFRLVFRNVTPESETHNPGKNAAPQYGLVAVLTSSATYYAELQRGIQYRHEWLSNTAATRAANPPRSTGSSSSSVGSPIAQQRGVPEAVAREVRAASPLSKLCTSLARVLERFSAVDLASCQDGADEEAAANGVADGTVAKEPLTLTSRDPWTYLYTREGPRLRGRIDVVERTPEVLRSWRDGALELTEQHVAPAVEAFSAGATTALDPHKSTHPLLTLVSRHVPCARLLLLPSCRDVTTVFAENELSSYLPKGDVQDDAAVKSWGVVYAIPAAERLRRWVLQGLVCAEVHSVRAVLLELDPTDLLMPCVELLYEGSDAGSVGNVEGGMDADEVRATSQLRYRRALFLVCQVVMETVERFVRCSGLVWRVTVAVKERKAPNSGGAAVEEPSGPNATSPLGVSKAAFTNVPFTLWCRDILDVIARASAAQESNSTRNTLSFVNDDDDAAAQAVDEECGGAAAENGALVVASANGSKQLVVRPKQGVDGALAIFTGEATGPAAPVPGYVVQQAKAVGIKVSDDTMHPLFRSLCAAARQHQQVLPVSALVDLLLEEWTGGSAKWRHHAPSRLVCPLDSCGVPVNRARVQRFLQPFLQVMRTTPGSREDAALAAGGPHATLNYAQFSMVMLAIAKM